MTKAPPTPKGFRDIGPEQARKRREIINKIADILEEFEFEPIETPTIEFAEVLLGKYGEEADRLIYKFTDRGGRELALRYDLTVPLARYVATNNPPLPFRRYQIGQVFRGENPQKGRWREFTQMDADTVGSSSLAEDAKIITAALKAAKKLGLKGGIMAVNDRKNFEGIPSNAVGTIDKLEKIGREGVEKELRDKGYGNEQIGKFIESVLNAQKTETLKEIFLILNDDGLSESYDFFFEPTLARGLDYYTGAIFELRLPSYGNLSLGGGGRYDNLIGMFAKRGIPAVGFSFGIDRIIEALNTT